LYVIEIMSKLICNVKNFLHHKIHMVKVKFKTKGQRSFLNMHFHKKKLSDDFLQIETNFIKNYPVVTDI